MRADYHAVGADDRGAFAEVDLGLAARLALHPDKRRRDAAVQVSHEPLDRLVVSPNPVLSHWLRRPIAPGAKPSEPKAKPSDPAITMAAFEPGTGAVEGFASADDPVITMAAFEPEPPVSARPGGAPTAWPSAAALTCLDTVWRSIPSSAAIRRYDHLSRTSLIIAWCYAILSRFAIRRLLPASSRADYLTDRRFLKVVAFEVMTSGGI